MAHLYCLKSRYLLKIFEVQTEAAKSFDFSAISLTFIIVWQAFCLTDTLELWILCCLDRFQIFQHFFPAEESHFYKATAGLRFHFVKNGGLLQVTSLALSRHAGFHAACFETAKVWLSFPDYSPPEMSATAALSGVENILLLCRPPPPFTSRSPPR